MLQGHLTMTPPGLTVFFCLCVFLIQYNGEGVQAINMGNHCGCRYNSYANLKDEEKIKTACAVSCLYSTLAGECNNICNKEWGQQGLPFGRLLRPDYCTAKSFDHTRCAQNNEPLPSARMLTVELFRDKPAKPLDKFLTSAHMAFGQFMSHDFGKRKAPMETDDICGKDQCTKNQECNPIQVPIGDPAFTPSPTMCLRFQRSERVHATSHSMKEQTNLASSYLDLSTVYGDTKAEMDGVRDQRKEFRGYLNLTDYDQIDMGPDVKEGKPLLPQKGFGDCRGDQMKHRCFLAGDSRVKDQPQMALYHTILLREHNRIAAALDQVNGGCWSQDRLFMEARKINYAQFQVMAYNEYLPLLVSEKNLKKWKLKLQKTGYTDMYDGCVNATVSNVFMTASFRFGHTQIPDEVSQADKYYDIFDKPVFSETYNNPERAYRSGNRDVSSIDALAFGMIGTSAELTDDFINPQVTDFFDHPMSLKNKPARDLLAIDIERGRDHGLPAYNKWLEFCGYTKAATFDDFEFITAERRAKLAAVYDHVDDVDLFVAGLLETPMDGDLSGPIFSCLNADQFSRARRGDRFWHEEKPNGFTKAQLQNIRQITSGKVFCENLDDVDEIQPNTLAHPRSVAQMISGETDSTWDFNLVYGQKLGHDNERVPCKELPGLDFKLWKEEGCFNPNCAKPYHLM